MLEEQGGDLVGRRSPGGLVGTDLQVPVMATLATARGASAVTKTIFEHRFRHLDELRKMGASFAVHGRTAWVHGVGPLTGARVLATDVRAAAALVLAGLGARCETVLDGLDHLDRGYDRMADKLIACGAIVARTSD